MRFTLQGTSKVFPSSDMILLDSPRLATKLFRLLMNTGVLRLSTRSRWTALTTQQVNRQIHTFSQLWPFFTYKEPAKSTPVWANGGGPLSPWAVEMVVLNRIVLYVFFHKTLTQDLLEYASPCHNPKSGPQLSQCGLDSTVHDSRVLDEWTG